MFLRKLIIELNIYIFLTLILWFLFGKNIASSFLCGASVSFVSNTCSAYMLLVYQAKSIKEEARRFYVAEFGKWSISGTMFALIFLYIDVAEPLMFFAAFIFANLVTFFFIKLKYSK